MATTAHDALRPLILLLHGLGATGAVWKSVEALLTERGDLRCLAPDLKGHGAASWAPRYSVGEMAADIATRLAGEAPVFIVGHSLGGYVALALAQGSSGVDVRGVVTIGTKLSWTLCIGAANRDAAEFPDPDRFDIGRTPNRHLAFAAGAHACAGMSVARLEAQVAIGRLVARFPRLHPAAVPVIGRRARFRGFQSLPASTE